jgi:hypothetical protein
MNPFALPSGGPSADWLIFLVMLASIGLGISIVVVWMVVFRTKGKKRKRRHRHSRKHNPTLAQSGSLPPMRGPHEPPPGP